MAEQRIEKDTFGDIAVAGRSPLGRADRALAAPLRHLDREDAARADPRAGAGQAQRRGRQPRARHARRPKKADAIVAAADEVLAGKHDGEFPLSVWQTGSGTQSNMNMNEVLANRASQLLGGPLGEGRLVHPNDDVNRSQSSNDVFPTAMSVAAVEALVRRAAAARSTALRDDARRQGRRVRRRSSRSAAPTCRTRRRSRSARRSRAGSRSSITAWRTCARALPHLCELALGGTAVGTGLNAPPEFGARVAAELAARTGPAVRLRAEQVRGARRARRDRLRARRAEDAGGVADQDRQRRALARLGPALGPGRDPHSRERAGQLDHAGQGQPDPVRGADDALRPGARQRRRDQHRRRVRQLRAQRLQAGADPQLPAERAAARPTARAASTSTAPAASSPTARASTSWCSAR